MKVNEEDRTVELTRRNLEALLVKLNGHPPNSACTIMNDGWRVKAVENAAHYADRPAGVMHDETEVAISRPETGVM